MAPALARSASLGSSFCRPATSCRHSLPATARLYYSAGPLRAGFTATSTTTGASLPPAAAAAATGAAAATSAATAAAPAAAAACCVLGLPAAVLFSFSSAVMVPVYGLLAFFPTTKLTCSTLLDSPALYLGLALLYTASLMAAWHAGLGAALGAVAASVAASVTSGGGLAALDLSPLARMFAQPLVTLVAWLHLLVLDVLMAREILLDGIRTGVATAHSVLLCFFFGPMGLLSHAITGMLARRGAPGS